MRTRLVQRPAVAPNVPVYDLAVVQAARRLLCSYCGGRVLSEQPEGGVVDLVCSSCNRTVGHVVLPTAKKRPSMRKLKGQRYKHAA